MGAEHIDLGLAEAVRLGQLTLLPAVRIIRRDDGMQEVVEPRVMQVLLALADMRGNIVRREELTRRCWEGRVVGEDAINRVLSRLRRVSEGVGLGSFRIETITKVGYRLVEQVQEIGVLAVNAALSVEDKVSPAPSRFSRRAILCGVATGGLSAAAGWRLYRSASMPEGAREAMDRGMDALRLMTPDQLAMAVAAFHQAAGLAPRHADPWGSMALAYRWLAGLSRGQEAILNAQRARDAAEMALRLDPANGDAQATLATLRPKYGHWWSYDRACAPVLAQHPDQPGIGILSIDLFSDVGRIRDVNRLAHRLIEANPGWPSLYTDVMLSAWCLGRLDEADAAIDHAFAQWPRHITVWFLRQMMLAYSGRGAAAMAMIADEDHRPVGLPDWDFDLAAAETRALMSRSTVDIAKATALYRERVSQGVGIAAAAVRFFAAVDQLDDAFDILGAFYFDRGFIVKDRVFTKEQGTFAERQERPTWLFWLPPMANLRMDRRVTAIWQGTGLADYWRDSGIEPDFPIVHGG